MKQLTGLRRPIHQKVFRTDFYELTAGCRTFILGELNLLLAGKKKAAMLARVPDLEHQLGQGETIALLEVDSDPWQVALGEYADLLDHHQIAKENLREFEGDQKNVVRRRLELVVQALQCYRKMRTLLVEAKSKRTDLN